MKTFLINAVIGSTLAMMSIGATMLYLPTKFEHTDNVCQAYALEVYDAYLLQDQLGAGNYLVLMHYANDYKTEYGVFACSIHYWADKL